MRTSHGLGRALSAAAAALLASACGTTVSGTTAADTTTPGTQGLTVPEATAGSASPGTDLSVPGAGVSGTTAGTSTSGLTPTGTNASTSSTVTPPRARTGDPGDVVVRAPGITATTIYIGMGYSPDANAGNAALGAAAASASYDSRDVTNAAFDYANKHGGFAGRKLVAVYHPYSISDDRNVTDQAACEDYTQDHKVFAIVADNSDILRACAEKAHAIAYGVGSATTDTFNRYPHYFDPAGIRFDRLGEVTVNGLVPQGYFRGKLGLITWDDPVYRATVKDGYLPAFAKHHIKLATPPVYIGVPQAVGAISDMSAAVSSAVAKFKALHIDHVIIQDGPAGVFKGGGMSFEFMNNAKSQRYYPRYGGNSYINPGSSTNPNDEEDHMLAVTDTDLEAANDEGWHLNKARVRCFNIMKSYGLPPKDGNINDEAQAALSCDMAFFLQRILNSLSVISSDTFLQAVTQMGTTFASAEVYGTNLFPGRRDGSDSVRAVEYFASCDCLKYKGPPYRVG